jgi:homoserine kinase type II
MNWDEVQREWPILEPRSIRLITNGVNNLTHLIETQADNYILRTYGSDRSLEHIRYELSVLTALRQKDLPFKIPAPIPTRTGKLFAVLSDTVVTMSPFMPGSMPQNENLEQAYAAGQALAELVESLADIEVKVTSQIVPFPPLDEFERWAGVPVDPGKLIQTLPLTEEEQELLLTLLENLRAIPPVLYQRLPRQIIHRDYDQSNVLMAGNVVTGILDFEFCGPDFRILDLAYALSQWPSGSWNTGDEWSMIDAFGRGYLQRQKLTSAEVEALPLIFRLRAGTSLFFRFGRYQEGLETSETLLERVQEGLRYEAWLQSNEAEFLRLVNHWYH